MASLEAVTTLRRISNTLFEYQPLNKVIIDSFNAFTNHDIETILRDNPIEYVATDGMRVRITMGDVFICSPHRGDAACNSDPLFPHEARRRGLTYEIEVKVTVRYWRQAVTGEDVDEKITEVKGGVLYVLHLETRDHTLMKVPCMLGSQHCSLTQYCVRGLGDTPVPPDKKTFYDVGECPSDPLGYFIVGGSSSGVSSEKILTTQEKLKTNTSYVKLKEAKPICECRSELEGGFIALMILHVSKEKVGSEPYISVSLPILPIIAKFNLVSFIRAVYILFFDMPGEVEGESSPSLVTAIDTLQRVLYTYSPSLAQEDLIEATISQAQGTSDEELLDRLRKAVVLDKDKNPSDDAIANAIERNFLPHIILPGGDGDEEAINRKMMFVGTMVHDLIRFLGNIIQETDLNSYVYKRLETPGVSMRTLFYRLYSEMTREVNGTNASRMSVRRRKGKEDTSGGYPVSAARKTIIEQSAMITKEFLKSFRESTWGYSKTKKKTSGVSIKLERTSISMQYALMRKLTSPVDANNTQQKVRAVHPSQFFMVCPVSTSEGGQCGIVRSLAVGAYITPTMSSDSTQTDALRVLRDEDIDILPVTSVDTSGLVHFSVNGVPLGFVDGERARDALIAARRRRRLHPFADVVLAQEPAAEGLFTHLYVSSTLGRTVRPLLIVGKSGRLVMDEMGLRRPDTTVEALLAASAAEYVDVAESEGLYIALDDKYMRDHRHITFTHMELNPSFLLSAQASILKFISHNPTPRGTYSSVQTQQFMGTSTLAWMHRQDVGMNITRYAQRSLVTTTLRDVMNFDLHTGGQNVIVAITAYEGYNNEDAIVINKSAIDRGLFNTDSYDMYYVEKSTNDKYNTEYPNLINGIIDPKEDVKTTFTIHVPSGTKPSDSADRGKLVKVKMGVVRRKNFVLRDYETNQYTYDKYIKGDPDIVRVSTEGDVLIVRVKECLCGVPASRSRARHLLTGFKDARVKVLRTLQPKETVDAYTYEKTFRAERQLVKGDIISARQQEVKAGAHGEVHEVVDKTQFTGLFGTVDKVENNSESGTGTTAVRMRVRNIIEEGDKLSASSHAQKGVIGLIENQENMPHSEDGMTPDLIISPHAIPSRMTMGLPLEMVLGQAIVANDRRKFANRRMLDLDVVWSSKEGGVFCPTTFGQLTSAQTRAYIALYGADAVGEENELVHATAALATYSPVLLPSDLPPAQQEVYKIMHASADSEAARRREDLLRDLSYADAFREIDFAKVEALMKEYGYDSRGEVTLMSGKTGKVLKSRVFMAPAEYFALKHMTKNKVHARNKGKIQAVTRQATRGKKKEGGVRFGWMEADAARAHGASYTLRERLMTESDVHTVYYCEQCQQKCYYKQDTKTTVCNICSNSENVHSVATPYSQVMMYHYLRMAGISMEVITGPPTDQYTTAVTQAQQVNSLLRAQAKLARERRQRNII